MYNCLQCFSSNVAISIIERTLVVKLPDGETRKAPYIDETMVCNTCGKRTRNSKQADANIDRLNKSLDNVIPEMYHNLKLSQPNKRKSLREVLNGMRKQTLYTSKLSYNRSSM